MLNDLRFAIRSLRNSPGFTFVTVVTLALGIGANATVFVAVDRLLFQPPPLVHQPDRVVRLYFKRTWPGGEAGPGAVTSYGVYRDLSEHTRDFSGLAAFTQEQDVSVGRGVEAVKASAELISSSYFPLLGVAPVLGRAFTAEDDRLDAGPTVVLGYGYWRQHFGGDPDILGRRLWIGQDA